MTTLSVIRHTAHWYNRTQKNVHNNILQIFKVNIVNKER